ncbi:MAG: hypothetical protein LBI87_11810, partial [Candidatus Accumulibacter sp.]|nr:hypothetical protein [Accumulibacter sp.]
MKVAPREKSPSQGKCHAEGMMEEVGQSSHQTRMNRNPSFPRKRESRSVPSGAERAADQNIPLEESGSRQSHEPEGAGRRDFARRTEKPRPPNSLRHAFGATPPTRGRLGLRRFAPGVLFWIPACAGMTSFGESGLR